MKKIKELIADLKQALEEAKKSGDWSKVEALNSEILTAEANMEAALKKANDEAKTSREAKEQLESEITELKKPKDTEPDPDKKKGDDGKDTKVNPEIKALTDLVKEQGKQIEKLTSEINESKQKSQDAASTQALSNALDKALKSADIEESALPRYRKYISLTDLKPDAEDLETTLKTRIDEVKQDFHDQAVAANGGRPLISANLPGGDDGKAVAEARNKGDQQAGPGGGVQSINLTGAAK